MNLGLKGKVIVVTGGAKGIGEGITRVLIDEGAIPVIIGRNENDNLKLVKDLKASSNVELFYVTAELNQPEASKKAINAIIEKYGRIEGLVNNAGQNDGVGLENGNYELF